MNKWYYVFALALIVGLAAGCGSQSDDVQLLIDDHADDNAPTLVVTLSGDTGRVTSTYLDEAELRDLMADAEVLDIHLVETGDDEFALDTCTYVIAAHEDDLVCVDFEGCGDCESYLTAQ